MKGFFPYILFLFVLLQGCTISIITIPVNQSAAGYRMYGGSSQRNFYVPKTVSDSLKLKWESSGSGGFANTSVTICDSIVFVADLSGKLYAYNSHNGKELGKLKNKGAIYGAPLVKNSWIIFVVAAPDDNETEIYFYDFTNGRVFREEKMPGRVKTEIAETGDGFVLATEGGRIQKLDGYGIPGWNIDLDSYIHCSPVYKDGIVVVGNDNGEITGINSENGRVIYKKNIGGIFRGGGSINGNLVYIGNDDGYLYAIDCKSGEVAWKFNTGARILMTPASDNNLVYAGNLNGDLFCVDKNSGALRWKYHSDGLFDVTPLVTGNLIFIPDLNRTLHIIKKNSGKTDKIIKLDGRGKLNPVLFNNVLYIGYDRGVVQAYEFK